MSTYEIFEHPNSVYNIGDVKQCHFIKLFKLTQAHSCRKLYIEFE